MLRTNLSFLTFIRDLHDKQSYPDDIVLKKFAVGDFILKQGGKPTKVYIIKEGVTKCFLSEENGKDYIVEFLSEGEIAGEIEVIKKMNCLCSIEAITEVRAYSITISLFNQLLEKDVNFNKLVLAELAERIINTSNKASTQQLYTIEHGLKKILNLQTKQNMVVSKEDMAAYLGITIRSLNRAIKGLQ